MTKLHEVGTALNTSKGAWRYYSAAFRVPVCFEIGDDFVAHLIRVRVKARMNDTTPQEYH